MENVTLMDGMVKASKGHWITRMNQPIAAEGGMPEAQPLRRHGTFFKTLFSVWEADRGRLCRLSLPAAGWFADAQTPIVTRINASLPLNVVTEKLLLAPEENRDGGFLKRVIPFTPKRAFCVTRLKRGWVITGTASTVTAIRVPAGEHLVVRPEALVAWNGSSPQPCAPLLPLRALVLPTKAPLTLLRFSGEATVWVEGLAPFATVKVTKKA